MQRATVEALRKQIEQLSQEDQLSLIEKVAKHLRRKRLSDRKVRASVLAAMAADPDIQREIKKINHEFHVAEEDGLENL